MEFNEIFANALISTFLGVIGGIAVYWAYNGIMFFDKTIRINNKKILERYFLKYSFIFLFLFFIITLISTLIYFSLSKDILNWILGLAIFAGIFSTIIIILKLR